MDDLCSRPDSVLQGLVSRPPQLSQRDFFRRNNYLLERNRPVHILVAYAGPPEIELTKDICSHLRDTWSICVELRVSTKGGSRTDEYTLDEHKADAWERCSSDRLSLYTFALRDPAYLHETLSNWADLLVLVVTDADVIAKMLMGMTDNIILKVLRGWNISKKIFMMPGMTREMWDHPLTKKQLDKIRRKWNWIQLFKPYIWDSHWLPNYRVFRWECRDELLMAVKTKLNSIRNGPVVDKIPEERYRHVKRNSVKLPVELWSIILEELGDWEIAEALDIPTKLSRPIDWGKGFGGPGKMRDIEETILRGSCRDVAHMLQKGPTPKRLSGICVKLIIKFEATDILSYLEKNHKDLFKATFSHCILPNKASAVHGKTSILEWWYTSPSFSTNKEYTNEAMDGASQAGFTQVLEWWRQSGLPLRYTEAALEQASAKGKIDVLEWWRKAGLHHHGNSYSTVPENWYGRLLPEIPSSLLFSGSGSGGGQAVDDGPLRLKVGKSISYAAQHGEVETIRWWDRSGIPYAHEESVARLASAYGHVGVLELWKELKGEKMIYDNQVLVGPTRNGHEDVLEWWKNSGFRVEYRPCDIEEALEDASNDIDGPAVRSWWSENGLDLGVGTISEWMQVKVLGAVVNRDNNTLLYPSVGAYPF